MIPVSLLLGCGDAATSPDAAAVDAASTVDASTSPDVVTADAPVADVPSADVPSVDVPTAADVPSTPTEGTIVVDNVAPWDIAIGGGYVYFTEANNVRRVPTAGGPAEMMYTTGSNSVATSGIDADGARFAWTERDANSTVRGAARACAHSGCGGTAPANLNRGESTQRIAIDGSHIFWTSASSNVLVGTSWASPSPASNLSRTAPSDVAIEGGDVFWVNAGLSIAMRPGTVLKCAAAATSCAPMEFPVMVGNPQRIAVRGSSVYVLSNTGLFRTDRSGGGLTRLADGATGNGGFIDLAADAAGVYWGDGGRLLSCDPSACTPRVIAQVTGQGSTGIALDATSVYWGTADIGHRTGAIRRVAR